MSSKKLVEACRIIRKVCLAVCLGIILMGGPQLLCAQDFSGTLVLAEPGFLGADSSVPTPQQLERLLSGARTATAKDLPAQLKFPATRLLLLPYGSAFPEEAWPAIFEYLRAGGNLLVLGGRPFTRAAYREGSGWRLRDYSVRFTRQLQIDQYQDTPGSGRLEFQNNPDIVAQLPQFAWKRAFSPVIRLSAVDLYKRGGSAGSIDARLDAFAWGVRDGRKLAAPAMQVDHLRNGFNGGRWVFLSAELPEGFFDSPQAGKVITVLAEAAMAG